MKTYYISPKSASLYSLIGLLAILMTSCGSYQNSSYYDSDGVYNNNERRSNTTANNESSNGYRIFQIATG